MHKIFSITSILLATGTLTTQSQATVAIEATFAYESEYVFRAVQYADHSFQPGVEVSYEGFYFGVWSNQPIVDPGAAFLNEVDFYGGYGFDINDTVSADFGLTYYWFPEEPSASATTREIYGGFSFAAPLDPSVYFYYDFDLKTFTVEGSAGYSIPLGSADDSPYSLDLGANVGWVSPKGGSSGFYTQTSADISYSFTENASLSFGIRASAVSDAISAGRTSNFWFGASFSAGF
jgi:uncharacterized protein (TIGR02001 family)